MVELEPQTEPQAKLYVQFHFYAKSTKRPVTCEQSPELAELNAKGVEEMLPPRNMNVYSMISVQSMIAIEKGGSTPAATFLQAKLGNGAALITKSNLKEQRKRKLSDFAGVTIEEHPLNVVFLCTNL